MEVFDMGCGSGLVGKHLAEFGFKQTVGNDCSQGMLDEIKKNRPDDYKEL